MSTRLYVSFKSQADLAATFDSTEATIATVDAAWKTFFTSNASEDEQHAAYLAAEETAKNAGLVAWFAESGEGFGGITTRGHNYAVAQGICADEDYCGGTSVVAQMRKLVTLQLDKAVEYERRGWYPQADSYREAADRVVRAIEAGVVTSVSFG